MAKSKYREDFPRRAKEYAEMGLIDTQIARNLGISQKTFYTYQEKYPQFLQAIRDGKVSPNKEVENALFNSATGMEVTEVTIETIVDKNGNELEVLKKKTVTKELPPNYSSIAFWLKNRMPDEWRDKQEIDHNFEGTVFQLPPADGGSQQKPVEKAEMLSLNK